MQCMYDLLKKKYSKKCIFVSSQNYQLFNGLFNNSAHKTDSIKDLRFFWESCRANLISMSSHVKSTPLDIKKVYIIQNCFKYQSRLNENRIHKVFVWALSWHFQPFWWAGKETLNSLGPMQIHTCTCTRASSWQSAINQSLSKTS